jgi:hypothetical protein
MGYGGNTLAGAYPGQEIPKEVAEGSNWLPYTTQEPYNAPVFKLMARIHDIKKYLRILPGPVPPPRPLATVTTGLKGKDKAEYLPANEDSKGGGDMIGDGDPDGNAYGDLANDPDDHLGLGVEAHLRPCLDLDFNSDSDEEDEDNIDEDEDRDGDDKDDEGDSDVETDPTSKYARAVNQARRLRQQIRNHLATLQDVREHSMPSLPSS